MPRSSGASATVSLPDPFIDIHCHILPGVDDGSVSWDESLEMARLAVADGISTAVATVHQLGGYPENDGQTVRSRCRQMQELLRQQGVPLEVFPGADVRVEPDLADKIRCGEVVTLGDRRRYVLLELPHELYFPLDRLLRELHAAGLVGVLSHPERNRGILSQPQVLGPLVDAGCLLQVTAGSLVGAFGSRIRGFAERLVAEGLAHFVATDAHGAKSRRPLMRGAFDRVCEITDESAARLLCSTNPGLVVADGVVASGRRRAKGFGRAGWFRRKRAG
ncbi:MAG: tyrosine-protein phosphatase [Planctomycetota bacterium]|jgi:protein-tyrosine phosphatase